MSTAARPRVIAITPNPALDITICANTLVPDTTIRIPTALKKLGGKGVNVASVSAEQGYSAFSLGPVPKSWHQAPEDTPRHLRPYYSDTPAGLRSTYALYMADSDTTTIFNEPGYTHPTTVFSDILEKLQRLVALPGPAVVTLSGSFPPQTPPDFLENVIQCTHAAGAKVIVDTSGDALLQACAAQADLLKPNAAELLEATGCTDVGSGAHALLERGAKAVLVSLGADGLNLVLAEQTYHAKLTTPCTGNPTGAGDALVAAVATSLLDDLDYPALLERAVSWSAAAVLAPVAGSIEHRWYPLLGQVTIT